MTRTFSLIRTLGLFCLIAFAIDAHQQDSPGKQKYYSPNKKYYVEVVPRKLDNKHGGRVREAKNNYAKGTLFKQKEDGSYRKLRSFRLVNEFSPGDVIVSNSGTHIATFDNWYNSGYGPESVVIYRSDGSVVRQLALEDFLTANDISTLPSTGHSGLSRWWGRDHYFEDKTNLLVLRVVSSNENPGGSSNYEGAKFYEVRLNPETGNLVEAKRDLLPRWEAQVSSDSDQGIVAPGPGIKAPEPACVEQSGSATANSPIRVSSAEFYGRAVSKPLPRYPPIARQAHAEGTVVVEVVTNEAGKVTCARGLSGHPLLVRVAVAAAKEWTFSPSQGSGGSQQSVGNIAFRFQFVKVVP